MVRHLGPGQFSGRNVIFQTLTWDATKQGVASHISGPSLQGTGSAGSQAMCLASVSKSSGLWYFEMIASPFGTINCFAGVNTASGSYNSQPGQADADGWSASLINVGTGSILHNGAVASTGTTFANNDVCGVAVDFTGDTIKWYKNNTLIYTYTSAGITGLTLYPVGGVSNDGTNITSIRLPVSPTPLTYTPPSGYTVWA